MNDNLENKLTNNNIKPTAMRLLVLQYLMEQKNTISLKDLEAHFFKADTSTLYRTLKTFQENSLIHIIDDGSGKAKYALNLEKSEISEKDQHYHFHCNKCGETYCLNSHSIPKIELPTKFIMQEANLVLKGICANCSFL